MASKHAPISKDSTLTGFVLEMTRDEQLTYLDQLAERLLEHKYRYYVKNYAIVEDFIYDIIERTYDDLSKYVGVEPWAANMVGFDTTHPRAQAIMEKLKDEVAPKITWRVSCNECTYYDRIDDTKPEKCPKCNSSLTATMILRN